MGNPWGEWSGSCACTQFYTGCFGGSSLIERCFCGDERVLDSSELPTYLLALVLCAGLLGGVTGQEGARKLDLKRRKCHSPGSLATAQSCCCCIQGNKASLCPVSPAQPSPGWEQPQTASQSTKYTICFLCASGCCLLGPSRSQDPSQGSVESRGRRSRAGASGKWSWLFLGSHSWEPRLPASSLDLSLPLCKRNRLCVMILRHVCSSLMSKGS